MTGTTVSEFHKALLQGETAFFSSFASNVPHDVLKLALNTTVAWDNKDKWTLISDAVDQYNLENDAVDSNILNTEFRFDTTGSFDKDALFCLPLSLSALSANEELVQNVLQHGVDIHAVDFEGRNVIHDLVYWSEQNPKEATRMYNIIMNHISIDEEKNELLRHEDVNGRNCLDLASEKYLPEMLLAILNTDGVYKYIVKDCLLHQHIFYDVSDYEAIRSKKNSPLFWIKGLTNKEVARFDQCNFFKAEPIQTSLKLT